MADELTDFVRRALGKGLAKAQIESKLLEAGWPRDEVANALAAYADVEFPVPVPRPRPYLSAREAFVYLLLFLTLYITAIAWGNLFFQFVHYAFPDPGAGRGTSELEEIVIRWSTACVLIAIPVFLWLSRSTYLSVRRNPEKRRSKVRKWLTYLTLFIAAGVLLCDLITLVYYLLAGELTVRFILKVLIVGAIAGAVFGFYLWHLRQDDVDPSRLPEKHTGVRVFATVVVAAVVASVIGGLILAGSPGAARSAVLDEQRQEDLDAIASAIDSYWNRHKKLPVNLKELSTQRGIYLRSLEDPETGGPYEYRSTGERAFELCATFDRVDREESQNRYYPRERFWDHGAGRTCFALEVVETGS